MRRRAEYRNELKTRTNDRVYEAFQLYKQMNGIDSDSAALNRLMSQALLGVIGILPGGAESVSATLAQVGTRIST